MDLKALCTSASLFCTVFRTVTSSAVVLLMLLRIVLVSRSVDSRLVVGDPRHGKVKRK